MATVTTSDLVLSGTNSNPVIFTHPPTAAVNGSLFVPQLDRSTPVPDNLLDYVTQRSEEHKAGERERQKALDAEAKRQAHRQLQVTLGDDAPLPADSKWKVNRKADGTTLELVADGITFRSTPEGRDANRYGDAGHNPPGVWVKAAEGATDSVDGESQMPGWWWVADVAELGDLIAAGRVHLEPKAKVTRAKRARKTKGT